MYVRRAFCVSMSISKIFLSANLSVFGGLLCSLWLSRCVCTCVRMCVLTCRCDSVVMYSCLSACSCFLFVVCVYDCNCACLVRACTCVYECVCVSMCV